MHKRTCTGPIVAPAPKRRRTASAVPDEVDMKESDNLTALKVGKM